MDIKTTLKDKTLYLLGAMVLIFLLVALIVYYRVRNKSISVNADLNMGKPDNHNVGNIRTSNIFWQGEVTVPGEAFEHFKSDQYGFRAMFKLLTNYVIGGYFNIKQIITHYAPPTDGNNTEAYIANISSASGLLSSDVLTVELLQENNGALFKKIVKAMSKVERGRVYDDSIINAGYQLYLQG